MKEKAGWRSLDVERRWTICVVCYQLLHEKSFSLTTESAFSPKAWTFKIPHALPILKLGSDERSTRLRHRIMRDANVNRKGLVPHADYRSVRNNHPFIRQPKKMSYRHLHNPPQRWLSLQLAQCSDLHHHITRCVILQRERHGKN